MDLNLLRVCVVLGLTLVSSIIELRKNSRMDSVLAVILLSWFFFNLYEFIQLAVK